MQMKKIQHSCINVINSLKQEGWSDRTYALVFNLFIVGVFICALIEARNFPPRAVAYPLVLGVVGLIAAVVSLFGDVYSLGDWSKQDGESAAKSYQVDIAADHSIPPRVVYARAAKFLGWFIGYYVAIFLLGLVLATVLFFVMYFRIVGKDRLWVSAVITLVVAYFMFGVIATAFEVVWPTGVFEILVDPLPVPGFGLN